MKKRFFILFLAILFVFSSCSGDDPVEEEEISDNSQENSGISDDSGNQESSDTSLPDPDASDNENSEKNDDGSNSKPDDDKTNDDGTDDNGQATGDDDASTDSNGDSDEPQSDDDTDSGSGTTDDTDQTDGDTDDPDDDTDADADTADPDEDTDVDTGADSGEEDPDNLTVTLPYDGVPVDKTITLNTKINKIDVLLMVDLSGMISAAHNNLKANVKTAIIDKILEKTPDSAFGVVTFGTIEQGNAYNLAQPITKYANDIKNAINGIKEVTSGSRTYHGLALWEAASGEADYEHIVYEKYYQNTETRKINIPAVNCNGQLGNIGGACFRSNAMPVFVMMTAKKFSSLTYNTDDNFGEWKENTEKKTKPEAVKKMNAIHAKFIGVPVNGTAPKNDFEYIATQTKSQDTAEPANYFNIIDPVGADDETFSAKIAEQVNFLTENIRLDVTANFGHKDNEYDVADTTQFVVSFFPKAAQKLKTGDNASFDITFENKIHENTTCEPHTFKVTLEATGEGLILDTREITIIVPGKDCSTDAH